MTLLLVTVLLLYSGNQLLNTSLFTNFYCTPNAFPLFLTSEEAGPLMVRLAGPPVKISNNHYIKKIPGSCEWLVVYAGDAKNPPEQPSTGF